MDGKFAHDSHKGHFPGFAALAESLVEGGQSGIPGDGRDSGHVEGLAGGGSSAPGSSTSSPLATVAIKGGYS